MVSYSRSQEKGTPPNDSREGDFEDEGRPGHYRNRSRVTQENNRMPMKHRRKESDI